MGVLKANLEHYGIKANIPPAYCTLKAAKKYLPVIDNHRLSTLADYYSIELNHHEALSDARAAAKLALEFRLS